LEFRVDLYSISKINYNRNWSRYDGDDDLKSKKLSNIHEVVGKNNNEIIKSGNITICTNYRPITITLSLSISKIFEKGLKQRLIDFLNIIYNFFLQTNLEK